MYGLNSRVLYVLGIGLIVQGLEQKPVLVYAIILLVVYLVATDKDLQNLIKGEMVFVGMVVLAVLIYNRIRNLKSSYV